MVFFNWATMQMAAKIVYYGPGLCGKTSNLSYIYAKTSPGSRGEMVSLETESDRTLFFDLLPIEVGTIGGFKTRLQLYTVPGQVFYNTTRKLVLKGVDGVVFVADSQRPMRDANTESFEGLRANLEELGLDLNDIPLVLQYNKRDLPGILEVDELNEDLNPDLAFPYHESSAINGDGVFETLKDITKLTLKKLRKRMTAPQDEPAAPPTSTRISEPAAPPKAERPKAILASALARAAEEGVDSGGGMPVMAAEPDTGADVAAAAVAVAAEPMPQVEELPAAAEVPESLAPQLEEVQAAIPEEPEILEEVAEIPETSEPEIAAPAASPDEPHIDSPSDGKPEGASEEPPAEDERIVEFDVSDEGLEEVSEAEPSEVPSFDSGVDFGSVQPEVSEEAAEELEEVAELASDDGADLAESLEEVEADVPEISVEAIEEDPLSGAEVTEEPDSSADALVSEDSVEDQIFVDPDEIEREVEVEFDRTDPDIEATAPPPVKRVTVSNQMDILAELDGLRKQATMMSTSSSAEGDGEGGLDLDSLLSPSPDRRRKLNRRVEHALNSDVFTRMGGVQLAIRIQDENGDTIHTLEPVSCSIDKASDLEAISLLLTLDLENTQ